MVVFLWNNLFHGAVNFTPAVGTNDYMDTNIPFRQFYNNKINQGKLPIWSKDISSGYPILAEGQIQALNPLNLLTTKLPANTSYAVSLAIAYFIIFIFTYLYLREIKLSSYASLLGAVAAAFSGFAANERMHLGMLNSFAFFIGMLWLIEKQVKSGKLLFSLLAGFVLGLSILSGHPQIIIYSLLFIYFYWSVRWMIEREQTKELKDKKTEELNNDMSYMTNRTYKTNVVIFIIGVFLYTLIGLGIGAGQLIPQYEFTVNSTRAAGLTSSTLGRYTMNFDDLVSFVSPFANYSKDRSVRGFATNGWPMDEKYIYMGIIPIILALAALYMGRKNVFVWIFSLTCVLAFIFSMGDKTPFGAILGVPPLSYFRIPFRILFLSGFSVSVLAAVGVERIINSLTRYKAYKRYIIFGTLFISGIVFIDLKSKVLKLYPEVNGSEWLKEPEAVRYLKENLKDQERVTEEVYFEMSFPYYVNNPKLWDDPRMHKNLRNSLPIFNNLLYSIPKNTPAANSGGLKIARYNELEAEISFNGFKYNVDGTIGVADTFLFLNRIMGVKYILSNKQFQSPVTMLSKKINLGENTAPLYIYEFFDYFPRQFLVPHAEKAKPEDIKNHLLKADFEPLQKIFIEEDPGWGAAGGYSANSHFVSYEDMKVVIKTQASGDGFLFLSDTYYPGWRAWVDGQETEILRANYAFRAVKVPEGEHEVVYRYEPESLRRGVKISLISLIGLTGLISLLGVKRIFRF